VRRWRPLRDRLTAAAALALAAACVAPPARRSEREGRNGDAARRDGGGAVRVALATAAAGGTVGATAGWRLYDGASTLVRGTAAEPWRVERRGRQLRAVRADGVPTAYRDGPLVVRPVQLGALVTWNGTRYRGELAVTATDSGLLVVNRVPVEDYLRGVVPLEIGLNRTPAERAAVEAQAVAARSYTYVRLGTPGRAYDVRATVADQVYGGAGAERPLADAAVSATRGLVLTYGGRVVNAPYHSTCGGSTAEVPEVWWRQSPEPYLRRVSDRIPGTARYYCEQSPTFTWTRSYDARALAAALDRYLRAYAPVPAGGAGGTRFVAMRGTKPSGRAAAANARAS